MAEISSTGGVKTTAHKGAHRLSNVYSNHELDRGQNTLIVRPNTQKTLIESSAANLGREQKWKQEREVLKKKKNHVYHWKEKKDVMRKQHLVVKH